MTNGPKLWDAILAQMPEGAVIAGGAVRDFYLGVEPKDIDVFMGPPKGGWNSVPMTEIPSLDQFSAATNVLQYPIAGFDRIDDLGQRDEEYSQAFGIELVSRGELFGYTVDAVVMADFDKDKLLDSFDFGITRSMYADGQLVDTIYAMMDRAHHVVTVIEDPEKWRLDRMQARFDRFNAAHGGDWTLRK